MGVPTAASLTEQPWTTAVLAALIQSGFLAFLPHSRKLSNQVMSWRAFGLERTPCGPTIAVPPCVSFRTCLACQSLAGCPSDRILPSDLLLDNPFPPLHPSRY